MFKEEVDYKRSADRWYIMCHLNPSWIESMLQKDSSGSLLREGEEHFPPYKFYIPYQYMPVVSVNRQSSSSMTDDRRYEPTDDRNGLRNDLHNFVFIQAPEERVKQIVASDWNTKSRLHLYYYRDPERKAVSISNDDMHSLIRTLQDHHLQFYFDQPVDDFTVGDKVILQMEPWVGKRAVIKDITVRKGQTNITVSLNIFQRTKSLNFRNVSVGDVVFEDQAKGRLLSGNPVNNYEEEIIDILSHRYRQKYSEKVAEVDNMRLKRLSTYAKIYVEAPDDYARFVALKLLCAYLRAEKHKRERYEQEVMAMLRDNAVPATDTEAYLMMALFITTRHPHYRDAVKDYRNSHPDCLAALRRYHSIVKELKPKKSSV